MRTLLITVFPISIILLLILLIIFVVRKGLFGKKGLGMRAYWVIGGYSLILITSMIIFLFMPKGDFAYYSPSKVDNDYAQQLTHKIFRAAESGAIDDVEELDLIEQWEIDYPESSLTARLENVNFGSTMIFVEKSPELNDIIDVTHYQTKPLIEGIEFTNTELRVNENQLQLVYNQTANFDITLTKLGANFTDRQFSGERQWLLDLEYLTQKEVYYLKIPETLEIIGDVQFVN